MLRLVKSLSEIIRIKTNKLSLIWLWHFDARLVTDLYSVLDRTKLKSKLIKVTRFALRTAYSKWTCRSFCFLTQFLFFLWQLDPIYYYYVQYMVLCSFGSVLNCINFTEAICFKRQIFRILCEDEKGPFKVSY